ncbi:class I SAM-dependent methyltransferase [Desulfococcaceae bacterium HSG9]|nr:class I SAM-dependent methyltransferase [Desulfococcaceae bacterium HSG9]
MKHAYDFPPLKGGGSSPIWMGDGFLVNGRPVTVLKYNANSKGWDGNLTIFHEADDRGNHPINMASRSITIEQLEENLEGQSPVILEIGCSSGIMLRSLRERFQNSFIIGSDCIGDYLENLANDLIETPIIQFDLLNCPLPDQSTDAVVMLNVLEHIENDAEALLQVRRILKPGGILILEVPSGPSLYSLYDQYLLHYRRYSNKGLKQLAIGAGFNIIRQSHLGFLLYPIFVLVKKRDQLFMRKSAIEQKKIIEKNIRQTQNNFLFRTIINIELQLGKHIAYPFGVRCLMTCRKPY